MAIDKILIQHTQWAVYQAETLIISTQLQVQQMVTSPKEFAWTNKDIMTACSELIQCSCNRDVQTASVHERTNLACSPLNITTLTL